MRGASCCGFLRTARYDHRPVRMDCRAVANQCVGGNVPPIDIFV